MILKTIMSGIVEYYTLFKNSFISFPLFSVFNRQGALRYSLTFPDAIKECLDNGYVIADEADMIEARDTGFYECVCGWISDGSIRLILQQNEPGCWYVYTDGYEDCSTDLEGLADVWCKWED